MLALGGERVMILKSIWAKISAGLAVVAAFLFMQNRWQSAKIENLEDENEALEKKEEITEYMEEAEVSERIREENGIERKADQARSSWRDHIND